MDIEQFLENYQNFQNNLLSFIDADTDEECNEYFPKLTEFISSLGIAQNKEKFFEILHTISQTIENRHCSSFLIIRMQRILNFIRQDIGKLAPKDKIDIFKRFRNQRRFLILLFKCKVLYFDNPIHKDDQELMAIILKQCDKYNLNYCYFLYPEIKCLINKRKKKRIISEFIKLCKEKNIDFFNVEYHNKTFKTNLDLFEEQLISFEEKCLKGENHTHIFSLIRDDLINDFVEYITRTGTSLNSEIIPSIFETNPFLLNQEKTTLIEYAAFCGSEMILKYLRIELADYDPSLWLYTIHSNNKEMVHYFEDNIEISNTTYLDCFEESVKCYHNEIAQYIKGNYLDQQNDDLLPLHFYRYFNFSFFPKDILSKEKEAESSDFSLHNIDIPSYITELEDFSFDQCFQLKKVVIPTSVKSIGDGVFSGCTSLAEISIPYSVTIFGWKIFDGIKSLKITGNIQSIPPNLFKECLTLTDISIPPSVLVISYCSFYGCSSLTKIKIPSSVYRIWNNAFSHCFSLREIFIPSSVKEFGKYIFKGVKNLKITGDIKVIPGTLFSNCASLTSISIPPTVEEIEAYSFCGCTSLTKIEIPSLVKNIRDKAFCNCSSLKEISILSSAISFGCFVFNGAKSVKITGNVECIDALMFQRNDLVEVFIQSPVITIDDFAFLECIYLRQIILPPTLITINKCAFKECTSLTQISIPSSVTSIGNEAFFRCSQLKQISFENPSSLKSIGEKSFKECSSLKSILIPSSVKSIGIDAFETYTILIKRNF